MTDMNRHEFEDIHIREAEVDSSTVIEIGDNLFLDTDDAKPASSFTWQSNLADTQEAFAEDYLGVAVSASADGDTDPVRYARGGVMKFPCSSATFGIGAPIAPAKASGDNLLDQEVAEAASALGAIGRVTERYDSSVTEVRFEIMGSKAPYPNHDPLVRDLADAELGTPQVIKADYNSDAEQHIFDAAVPRKIRIIDAWVQIGTAGGTSATIELDDGTNSITDSIAVGDSQSAHDIKRAGSLDDDYHVLSSGDTLDMTTGGTQGSMAGTMFILVVPVA